MSMVEPELALFQMQAEGMFGNAVELRQPAFGKAPERLNAIDVMLSSGEFVVAVADPEMLVKADVHQPVVAASAVGVDDAVDVCLAPDNGLQRGLRSVGDDFGVDAIAAFEQAEDDGLAIGSPPAFAAYPSGSKVGFVGSKLSGQWRAFDAPLAHAASDTQVDAVDRTHRYASQGGAFGGGQVQRKVANNLTKLRFADLRTFEVSIFTSHIRKLACKKSMFASLDPTAIRRGIIYWLRFEQNAP